MKWRGGPAPALVLKDAEGKSVNLRDFRGSTVLVNFWATWCGPCVDELPAIDRLRERMAGTKFTVIAVDVGESAARVNAFLKKTPVGFAVLLDPDSELSRKWKVHGLPTTYVIGPDGRIRFYQVGDLDWGADAVYEQIRTVR